jgi:hypothetical protein
VNALRVTVAIHCCNVLARRCTGMTANFRIGSIALRAA